MVIVIVLVGVFVAWRELKRRRQSRLAGLTSAAPMFSIEPPRRWSTSLRDHRL